MQHHALMWVHFLEQNHIQSLISSNLRHLVKSKVDIIPKFLELIMGNNPIEKHLTISTKRKALKGS